VSDAVLRPAAFLDRDGTIIEEREYLSDPAGVVLLPGAAAGLRRLAAAGYALVVVTNQSGIARGYFTEAAFRAVQRRLADLLAAEGVMLDGVFHCPHHPELTGACDCRKPALGMYRAAAARLGLDLRAAIYVGDRAADVTPAIALGGRGFLVRTGYGERERQLVPADIEVVADLDAAARAATRAETSAKTGAETGAEARTETGAESRAQTSAETRDAVDTGGGHG
jgi:D-glycero-D-manno-heptose 1,7-bisphosphate phosphatase